MIHSYTQKFHAKGGISKGVLKIKNNLHAKHTHASMFVKPLQAGHFKPLESTPRVVPVVSRHPWSRGSFLARV